MEGVDGIQKPARGYARSLPVAGQAKMLVSATTLSGGDMFEEFVWLVLSVDTE